MDKEKRQEYNKTYYIKNKDVIIDKHYKTKATCEFCNRQVSKANITKHYVSSLCVKRQRLQEQIANRKLLNLRIVNDGV